MTNTPFRDWIERAHDDPSIATIRCSLFEEQQYLPWTVIKKRSEDRSNRTFVVQVSDDVTKQYELGIDPDGTEDEVTVYRREFDVATARSGSGDADYELTFVVELVNGDIPPPSNQRIKIREYKLAGFMETDWIQPVGADRVAGLDHQRVTLERFLEADYKSWGLSEQTGILLEGPPGTGKTELVKEVCEEKYGEVPVSISGPEVLSKWVGESERILREKFEEARDRPDSPILYIDELDAIGRSRDLASQDHGHQLVAQLLVLLDGIDQKARDRNRSLKVIGSTNLAEVLDPALLRPGRFGSRPIEFRRPAPAQRTAILHHYLEQSRRAEASNLGTSLNDVVTKFQTDLLSDVVTNTEGFTGADLEDLILKTVERLERNGGGELTVTALQETLTKAFDGRGYGPFTDEKIIPDSRPRRVDTLVGRVRCKSSETDTVRDIARRHVASMDRDECGTFRRVSVRDLLGPDQQTTREHAIETLQTPATTPLIVYLMGAPKLNRAKSTSSLLETLVETLHEEVLKWPDDNVLVYAGDGDDPLISLPTTDLG
jgi:transitional endoplasmic reticulum ATPase